MNYLQRADAVLARARVTEKPPDRTLRRKAAERADPWRHVLAGVEDMPDTPGKVARISSEIRIASGFLLDDVLGLDERIQIDNLRLAKVMRWLGWDGPKPLWMGEKVCKGYAKTLERTC
jgi:putative DNA primase/helicase